MIIKQIKDRVDKKFKNKVSPRMKDLLYILEKVKLEVYSYNVLKLHLDTIFEYEIYLLITTVKDNFKVYLTVEVEQIKIILLYRSYNNEEKVAKAIKSRLFWLSLVDEEINFINIGRNNLLSIDKYLSLLNHYKSKFSTKEKVEILKSKPYVWNIFKVLNNRAWLKGKLCKNRFLFLFHNILSH